MPLDVDCIKEVKLPSKYKKRIPRKSVKENVVKRALVKPKTKENVKVKVSSWLRTDPMFSSVQQKLHGRHDVSAKSVSIELKRV